MPPRERTVEAEPFAGSRLPPELFEFVSKDTCSLMIRGESGTGKTILALSILRSLLPLENVLYISTRTSPLQLFEYYPWIREVFGDPSLDLHGAGGGWETLIDSRLDEPNAVFEHITDVLMDKQAPTLVIDSWEALEESMQSDALRADLKVLESWRERAGARFIFVGEDPVNSTIDHLVEGAVVLRQRMVQSRRVRELFISKLRGIQIRRPSHFFTLEGGEFQSFPEYSPDDYEFDKPLPVRLDRPLLRTKGRVPLGYASLDSMLNGGVPARSVTELCLGEGVHPKVGLVLIAKLVQDWTQRGGQVVLEDSLGVRPGFLRQYAKSFGGKKGGVFLGPRSLARSRKDVLKVASTYPDDDEGGGGDGRVGPAIVVQRGRAGGSSGAPNRLNVSLVEGTLFVAGEVPWTPLFGAVPGAAAGNPQMQLEPVV